MSEKYTSLEQQPTLLNHTNWADRWLNRLACLNSIVPNNRNRRKPYLFDYGKYDEEQFREQIPIDEDSISRVTANNPARHIS